MSETPVNLNRVRKAKARTADRRLADENSIKFGTSKAERDRRQVESNRARLRLDGHMRDKPKTES